MSEPSHELSEFEQLLALKAENANLKEVIKSALAIKALWFYGEVSLMASSQHRCEAQALAAMAERFEQALKEPNATKNG